MKDKNIKNAREFALTLIPRMEAASITQKQLFDRAGLHANLLMHWLNGKGARKSSLRKVEIVMRHYEAIAKKYPAHFNQPKEKDNG